MSLLAAMASLHLGSRKTYFYLTIMDNTKEVRNFISSLDLAIKQLEDDMNPILDKSMDEIAMQENNQIEKAKVYNNYAYILVSTIFSYLKSSGVDIDSHPVKDELARVKQYMKRTKNVEELIESKDKQKESMEASRQFLQNTLGIKSKGTGNSAPASMGSPAISSSNFKGKHKKFKESGNTSEEN